MEKPSEASTDSGAAASEQPSSSHPQELVSLDQAYFAPWGTREILTWSLVCSLALAMSLVMAWFYSSWYAAGSALIVPFWAFMVLFFRNPSREITADAGVLVAPADGTVWDIGEVDEEEYIEGRCLRIGIFLSVFNVHVNRAPCAGEIEWLSHKEGGFSDARSETAALSNENNSIGMRISESEAAGVPLVLKQVSGAIARRIICPLKQKDRVTRGGLIGMIKYGSRTEIIIPLEAGFQPSVAVKDKVCGGVTILGRFEKAGEGKTED